jgi:hypothetical protein
VAAAAMLRGLAANESCFCLEAPLLRVGSGPVLGCGSHERIARSFKYEEKFSAIAARSLVLGY